MQFAKQRRQIAARLHVKAIKRFIEDQQIGLRHQRLTQQGFARLTRGEIFKPAFQQMTDTELRRQPLRTGGIRYLMLDNLRGGAAGIIFTRAE